MFSSDRSSTTKQPSEDSPTLTGAAVHFLLLLLCIDCGSQISLLRERCLPLCVLRCPKRLSLCFRSFALRFLCCLPLCVLRCPKRLSLCFRSLALRFLCCSKCLLLCEHLGCHKTASFLYVSSLTSTAVNFLPIRKQTQSTDA
jgi:hypothetical protein